MDVASFSRVNQIYSSSIRLFANALTTQQQQQQLDSRLIAFCTILTVALSVLLLSFKQSRLILLNATHVTTYPYLYSNVKKCFKICLRQLKVVKLSSVKSATSSTLALSNTYTSFYYNAATNKYLKLKRLQSNIAAASLAVTKSTCTNYLFKPLNKTFSTMRKTTSKLRVKNIISIKSKIVNGKTSKSFLNVQSHSLQCQTCDTEKKVVTSQSYPMFEPSKFEHVHYETNLHRSETWPKINSSKVKLYRKLPLRSMSRAWGEINSIDLPVWCRKPCFYFYSWVFNCNLDEIDIQDLNQYKNLSEFFRRALKPDARLIDTSTNLVCPCDGKILNFGRVEKGYLEQVKGVNYSLQAFLGEQNWPKNIYSTDDNNNKSSVKLNETNQNEEYYEKSILYNSDNCLYHCVIYLAPGDYHRFHSPTDWQVFYRRHFPGELFSVNPSVARWLHGLFNFNERVVYYGQWEHGFFSMTAVGATNVGSIKVYKDEGLSTNTKIKNLEIENLDKNFCEKNFEADAAKKNLKGMNLQKGENFGEFNLGSTIVLIFEAPKDFEFNVNQGDKVLFGRKLG